MFGSLNETIMFLKDICKEEKKVKINNIESLNVNVITVINFKHNRQKSTKYDIFC